MLDVVAAVLLNYKGQILIAKKKKDKSLGGYWEFPGGKVEEGERPEESLIRELKEEMSVEIEVTGYVGENIHRYEKADIRLIAFKGKIIKGNIRLSDHDEYAWADLAELKSYKLAPADIPIIDMLQQ